VSPNGCRDLEIAASLLGRMIHMILLMPSAEASIVASATGAPPPQNENGCLSICFNPGKRHARPEMRSEGSNELRNPLAT